MSHRIDLQEKTRKAECDEISREIISLLISKKLTLYDSMCSTHMTPITVRDAREILLATIDKLTSAAMATPITESHTAEGRIKRP